MLRWNAENGGGVVETVVSDLAARWLDRAGVASMVGLDLVQGRSDYLHLSQL
ncbi:hypothetical protein CROQUDRAFT_110984 [Cronartium quercuum f. sp. fusiforme G11]|uniref:Uncharacterized protein n=1 Tax=Cronartium quercuum f. sp. fusiforme G11 TaxID=708437 RepID=A0A9P6NBD0_9BASI|nr:hypothetical protein CROQUDRAFT_110984 [Cronartium quercuum f. sp. fusiforme G11]